MKNLILNIFLFQIFLFQFIPEISLARVDRELQESQKCSRQFSYFEKKYNLPKDILHSVSLQESQKKHSKFSIYIVWPWTVNVAGVGYHFNSKDEAVKFTLQKQAEGHQSIDVGCMQINLKYHSDAFLSVDQAFSPRKNIAYSAKFLKEKLSSNSDWKIAVGNYHSCNQDKSKKYSDNVSRFISNMDSYRERY